MQLCVQLCVRCVQVQRAAALPKAVKHPEWVSTLRSSIRDAGFARGWSVREMRGSVQIQHSYRSPDQKLLRKVMTAPIAWERGCNKSVLQAIETLSSAIGAGKTFEEASELVRDPAHQREGVSWQTAFEAFRKWKIGAGKVSERTFDRNDGRRLGHLLKRIEERQPENGKAVVWLSILSPDGNELQGGCKARKDAVGSAVQFLNYCCDHHGFEDRWLPPVRLADFKGTASKKRPSTANNAGKAIPFPEEAIKPLLDSFPKDKAGQRWRLAIGLIVTHGLRGVELNYLSMRGNQFWCEFIKSTEKGETDPRPLMGIDPVDMPGLSAQLIAEWRSGTTELPPLGSTDDAASSAISGYLRRRKYWNDLVAATREEGKKLSIYSFRHRYSARLDEHGFNARLSAALMGHSRHTFEQHYGNEITADEVIRQSSLRLAS